MKKNILFLFLLLIPAAFPLFAQIVFSGSVNLEGYYSNKEKLPFWFYSNQRGRVSEETNFAGWIGGTMNYAFSENTRLEIGGNFLYEDAFSDEVFIDELYAKFDHNWLEIVLGRKQKEELYNGLSAANENFAWSLNHRPLPGIQIGTSEPVYFNERKKFGFEFSWNEFLMGNDRFVKGTRLHYKSIYLVYNFSSEWHLKTGIKHFAQWGGDSPESGPQPESFTDYLKIVAGREGGENAVKGDKVNVVGGHLGIYELYLTREFPAFNLSFIYNHYFEDGTGSRYANFPDGRYGVFFEKKDDTGLLKSLIYEFYYTKNQSINSSAPHKNDNYFNNFLTYHSGWTYQRKIIGVPFFDYSREKDMVVGNRFLAHHLGLAGNMGSATNNFPYKFLMTYTEKAGSHFKKYSPKRDEVYLRYDIGLVQQPFNLRFILGAEYTNIEEPVYGVGLSLSKQF